jgi:hypothetical protein
MQPSIESDGTTTRGDIRGSPLYACVVLLLSEKAVFFSGIGLIITTVYNWGGTSPSVGWFHAVTAGEGGIGLGLPLVLLACGGLAIWSSMAQVGDHAHGS